MKRALVYGRYHISWIAWTILMERKCPPPPMWRFIPVFSLVRLVFTFFFLFLWRLLFFVLPYFNITQNGWGVHFLTFHVGVVNGPYICAYCGNATAQGPNLERGEKAHCWRCIGKMIKESGR